MSQKLADAFRLAGGDCHVLAAAGSEDHWLPEREAGVKIASAEFDRALKTPGPAVAKKR
jgi:hypothetical protein